MVLNEKKTFDDTKSIFKSFMFGGAEQIDVF